MNIQHKTLGKIKVTRIRSVTATTARRHDSAPGVVASFIRGNKLAGTCRLTDGNVSLVQGFNAESLRYIAELNDQVIFLNKELSK